METKVNYANGNFAYLYLYESGTLISGRNRPVGHRFGGFKGEIDLIHAANAQFELNVKCSKR